MLIFSFFFFFVDAPTPQLYTLSLHDALPISEVVQDAIDAAHARQSIAPAGLFDGHLDVGAIDAGRGADRKSTRLNSSHLGISYAVFCLKKKKHKKANQNNDKAR